MDQVDGFQCECQDGFSGDHCQCSGLEVDLNMTMSDDDNMTCVDINSTLSWTIPPDFLPDYDDQERSTIHRQETELSLSALALLFYPWM